MSQKDSHLSQSEASTPINLISPALIAMGQKRIEELIDAQTKLFEKLQDANRNWFDRLQSEATLASEFASKMTAARTMPETTTACQEWTSRCVELVTEDVKHFLADAQEFTEMGVRLLSNGWLPNGQGAPRT